MARRRRFRRRKRARGTRRMLSLTECDTRAVVRSSSSSRDSSRASARRRAHARPSRARFVFESDAGTGGCAIVCGSGVGKRRASSSIEDERRRPLRETTTRRVRTTTRRSSTRARRAPASRGVSARSETRASTKSWKNIRRVVHVTQPRRRSLSFRPARRADAARVRLAPRLTDDETMVIGARGGGRVRRRLAAHRQRDSRSIVSIAASRSSEDRSGGCLRRALPLVAPRARGERRLRRRRVAHRSREARARLHAARFRDASADYRAHGATRPPPGETFGGDSRRRRRTRADDVSSRICRVVPGRRGRSTCRRERGLDGRAERDRVRHPDSRRAAGLRGEAGNGDARFDARRADLRRKGSVLDHTAALRRDRGGDGVHRTRPNRVARAVQVVREERAEMYAEMFSPTSSNEWDWIADRRGADRRGHRRVLHPSDRADRGQALIDQIDSASIEAEVREFVAVTCAPCRTSPI